MALKTPPPPANLAELLRDPARVRALWQVVAALESMTIVINKNGVRRTYPLKLGDTNSVLEIDVS